MSPRDSVLQQALALSWEDQAYVAQSLDEHLAAHAPPISEELFFDAECLAELRRRSEECRTDKSKVLDGHAVMAELFARQAAERKP